jgi:Transglycosylase SLT domain
MRFDLDPALVCAVIEQESAWNTNAIRYEPVFRERYLLPLKLAPTEEVARSMSWGLMQVMGQVARENGFTGEFLSEICVPSVGIKIAIGAERDGSAKNGAAEARGSASGLAQGLPVRPAGRSAASGVELPLDDLKPLFDFVQDCRACSAQLAAAEKNRTDDAEKIAALTRQRDLAVSAARGGGFWHRLQHELEWFGAGAISGYIASRR